MEYKKGDIVYLDSYNKAPEESDNWALQAKIPLNIPLTINSYSPRGFGYSCGSVNLEGYSYNHPASKFKLWSEKNGISGNKLEIGKYYYVKFEGNDFNIIKPSSIKPTGAYLGNYINSSDKYYAGNQTNGICNDDDIVSFREATEQEIAHLDQCIKEGKFVEAVPSISYKLEDLKDKKFYIATETEEKYEKIRAILGKHLSGWEI